MSYRVLVWLAGLAVLAAAGLEVFRRAGPSPNQPSEEIAATPSLTLDDDQKKYLWEIEHHGNLLSRHGFKPLATAIQKADAAALERLLAADFTGHELGHPQQAALHSKVLDVVRHTDSGAPRVPLTGKEFVARLLELRKTFDLEPKVKLSLMALSPTTWGDLDSPWRGTALLRLWGEWQKGKPAEVIAYLEYHLKRPTSESLGAGGWLSACAITQSQVGRAERFLMRESAAKRGIDPKQFYDNWVQDTAITQTGGVYVCDFNRDGILDLLITDYGRAFLYRGQPDGSFRDVTESMGLPRSLTESTQPAPVAAFADLDGDGWEDLVLANRVYRNDRGRRFIDVSDRCNLQLPPDAAGLLVADYDRDGLVDLYATRPGPHDAGSWLTGKSGSSARNYLYRNKGNWQFEDVTYLAGADGDQPSAFTAAWLDVDDDGWPDLYVINEFGDGVLYRNEGRGPDGTVTFSPHRMTDQPCDFGSMGVAVGDVDGDGRIDVYCANMYSKAGNRVIGNLKPGTYPDRITNKMRRFVVGNQLHHNLGGLRFEQLGQALQVNDCGWAYGPALADLDNDGFLDLHATCGFVSRSRDDPDG
jgi:hypothetical protein